jgi:CelD/BcsL family acetyltransferase involved in cellulose biosynthesis
MMSCISRPVSKKKKKNKREYSRKFERNGRVELALAPSAIKINFKVMVMGL